MTRGRAILGIGPGERVGNEPYGVDWSKPVARFEEALATIRALWDSKGLLVKRDSPFFHSMTRSSTCRRTRESGLRSGSRRMAPHAAGDRAVWRRVVPQVRTPAAGLRQAAGDHSDRRLRRRSRSDVHHAGVLGAGHGRAEPCRPRLHHGQDLGAQRSRRVPLSVVKGMVLNGTVDDMPDQAAEWRDDGVRYTVVVNFSLADGAEPQAAVICVR